MTEGDAKIVQVYKAGEADVDAMGLPCDWQTTTQKMSQRGRYLLDTGKWSDCQFIVGQDPHQQIVQGHKVFLAMTSPVFEAMFYGSMAEKNDPIPIRDVQPEAFKALMEYIYTDQVDLNSFELACELCYCAKKYMLPFLVEKCTKFLWSDLSLKKACRAYEFAKLFEEPVLMEKCLQIICTKTKDVLNETSWEEVEIGTVLTLLDQEELEIDSESVLFNAVERWAKAECARKSLDPNDPNILRTVTGDVLTKIRFLTLTPQEFAEGPGKSLLLTQEEAFAILMNISSSKSKVPMPIGFSTNTQTRSKLKHQESIDLRHIQSRGNSAIFGQGSLNYPLMYQIQLPQQPLNTNNQELLMRAENEEIVSRDSQEVPNEILITNIRDRPKFYSVRGFCSFNHSDCRNYDVMDSSVTFTVDRNIFVLGVQVPSQNLTVAECPNGGSFGLHSFQPNMTYTEVLYAHLLDSDGSRLTYTHYTTRASLRDIIEISFNRPVYIQKNKIYKVGVVFNKPGWYPFDDCTQKVVSENVTFTFNIGVNGVDYVRDGLIRSIVFTYS